MVPLIHSRKRIFIICGMLTMLMIFWTTPVLVDDSAIYNDAATLLERNNTIIDAQQIEESFEDLPKDVKKILFWNAWYHRTNYGFGLGRKPFLTHCPETRCATTSDARYLNDSDVVVVCGRLLDWSQEDVVPPRRDPSQLFVYFNREAPVTQMGNNHRLDNVFNMTMTYRLDSTIPFPYSTTDPLADTSGYKPVTLEDIKYKSKTNPVSWMVSRCHKSGCVRHEYVTELQRYIPVDIYGRCGNLSCPRNDNGTCMLIQERTYKFYMALENTVCKDYVTEKAFRTLEYNIVPIVMGGANYSNILPPHSFIDVKDFHSPKELAKYLHYLNDNDDEYLKFFEWKEFYKTRTLEYHEPFCKLCELLHQREEFLVNFDLESWWDGGSGEACLNQDYRAKLMEYFNLDPTIESVPRNHNKQLNLSRTELHELRNNQYAQKIIA